MGFERRTARPEPDGHVCPLPKHRWLPWLIIPSWSIGAEWRCGDPVGRLRPDWVETTIGYNDGCGALWRYEDTGLMDSYMEWVQIEPAWKSQYPDLEIPAPPPI